MGFVNNDEIDEREEYSEEEVLSMKNIESILKLRVKKAFMITF